MSPAAWGAVGALGAAMIGVIGAVVTHFLRSPERRAERGLSNATGWEKLVNGWEARVAYLENADKAKDEEIAGLREEIKHFRTVEDQLRQAFRYIRALLAWGMAGGGSTPPAPPAGLDIPGDDPS